jgi:hypothetical protein
MFLRPAIASDIGGNFIWYFGLENLIDVLHLMNYKNMIFIELSLFSTCQRKKL